MYRRYDVEIWFDGLFYNKVLIDPHYELKHKESITDQLILDILASIGGWAVTLNARYKDFEYYEVDGLHNGKDYRIIVALPFSKEYLGVKNAYRRSI